MNRQHQHQIGQSVSRCGLAKSWARSHNFHEAEVKLRAAILS